MSIEPFCANIQMGNTFVMKKPENTTRNEKDNNSDDVDRFGNH